MDMGKNKVKNKAKNKKVGKFDNGNKFNKINGGLGSIYTRVIPNYILESGRNIIDSRKVSDFLCIEHDVIFDLIGNLIPCSDSLGSMFEYAEFVDMDGDIESCYLMDFDGFLTCILILTDDSFMEERLRVIEPLYRSFKALRVSDCSIH